MNLLKKENLVLKRKQKVLWVRLCFTCLNIKEYWVLSYLPLRSYGSKVEDFCTVYPLWRAFLFHLKMSNLWDKEHHIVNMKSTSAVGERSSAQNHMWQLAPNSTLKHDTTQNTTCYFLTQHGVAECYLHEMYSQSGETKEKDSKPEH